MKLFTGSIFTISFIYGREKPIRQNTGKKCCGYTSDPYLKFFKNSLIFSFIFTINLLS